MASRLIIFIIIVVVNVSGFSTYLFVEKYKSVGNRDSAVLNETQNQFFEESENQKEKRNNTLSGVVYPAIKKSTNILYLGDIMLGRNVGRKIDLDKDPFLFAHADLEQFDVVIGNLEGPITDEKRCQKKAYSFKFATTTALLLSHHGISGVSLANNHSYDCFFGGLVDTRKYLSEQNIFYFGGGKLEDSYTSVNIGGRDILFVGIDQSIGDIQIDNFYTQIEEISLEHDFIVVNIHWGNEYEPQYSESQQSVAHALVDIGVDTIIGHHPHVMQPVEVYKGKPIFYSLGNFIFDQITDDTNHGYAVAMEFSNSDITWEVKPYGIINSRPAFYGGGVRDLVCDRILEWVEEKKRCKIDVGLKE